jgi:hypothetical protein
LAPVDGLNSACGTFGDACDVFGGVGSSCGNGLGSACDGLGGACDGIGDVGSSCGDVGGSCGSIGSVGSCALAAPLPEEGLSASARLDEQNAANASANASAMRY